MFSLDTNSSTACNKDDSNFINKHTGSIAKAIQNPHRPQQIEICNHYFGALFNEEQLELLCPLNVFLFHYLMFQTWYVSLQMETSYQLSLQLSFIYKTSKGCIKDAKSRIAKTLWMNMEHPWLISNEKKKK